MNQEKQPDAIELAARLETIAASGVNIFSSRLWMRKAATELQRLHALAETNRAEMVAEAARTAEEKLRADQMTKQHRMQTNMRKELEQKVASLQEELSSRDSWLAECRDAFSLPAVNTELDHHFCSAMTDPSEVPAYVVAQAKALEAQLSAIGAGGVEQLRKRDMSKDEMGVIHSAIQESAELVQTSRECLQQSEIEKLQWLVECSDGEMRDGDTARDVAAEILAALQAAPPAPAGVAVPEALRELIEAIEFTPLGVRAIQAMTRARAALAAAPAQAVAVPAGWEAVKTDLIEETRAALRKAQMFKLAAKWTERAALGATPAQAARTVHDKHPKDDEPRTDACIAALNARGDDRGQGLDGYWKWGFAAGFNAAIAAPAQEHATQLAGQGQEPSPPVAVTGPVEWPATCDGLEQEAWEAWARVQRFDMSEHPMHYLFLNERTDAARQGWKGGIVYAVEQMKQRVHVVEAAPAQAHKDKQA